MKDQYPSGLSLGGDVNDFSISGKMILSVVFFPVFFQGAFLEFAWGDGDPFWLLVAKRSLLLLPVLGIILGCWATVAAAVTVIVRQERRRFITAIVMTWWDLGRAIFTFWGGIGRFLFLSVGWLAALLRLLIFGFWLAIQDILLSPLRMAVQMGKSYVKPGVPWLALVLTVLWSAFEAGLFTYVTTSLVQDVLSGMSGQEINESVIQIPLYFTMFVLVLGSYAVLSNWSEAVKSREIGKILQIGVIEFVVLGFEVLFLYREFVDALVPWLAQYASEDFELGVFWTLAIAGFSWLGVRAMTWFSFASAGTPMIMSIIQRTGLQTGSDHTPPKTEIIFTYVSSAIERIKKDMEWVHQTSNEMLSAFILPPLQIIASCVNFITLVIIAEHVFELPFRSIHDITNARRRHSSTDPKEVA